LCRRCLLDIVFFHEAVVFWSWLWAKKLGVKMFMGKKDFYLNPHEYRKLGTFRKLVSIWLKGGKTPSLLGYRSFINLYLYRNLTNKIVAQDNLSKNPSLRQPTPYKNSLYSTFSLKRGYVFNLTKARDSFSKPSAVSSILRFTFRKLSSSVHRRWSFYQKQAFRLLLGNCFICSIPLTRKLTSLISLVLCDFFKKKFKLNKKKINVLSKYLSMKGDDFKQRLRGFFYWEKKKKTNNKLKPSIIRGDYVYEPRSTVWGVFDEASLKYKNKERISKNKVQIKKDILVAGNTLERFGSDENFNNFKVRLRQGYESAKLMDSTREVFDGVKSEKNRSLPRGFALVDGCRYSGNIGEVRGNEKQCFSGLSFNSFKEETASSAKNEKKKGLFAIVDTVGGPEFNNGTRDFSPKTKHHYEDIKTNSLPGGTGSSLKKKKRKGLFASVDTVDEFKDNNRARGAKTNFKYYRDDT